MKMDSKNKPHSFLQNSVCNPREGEIDLFHFHDGSVYARLNGYAVIPIEQFEELLRFKAFFKWMRSGADPVKKSFN